LIERLKITDYRLQIDEFGLKIEDLEKGNFSNFECLKKNERNRLKIYIDTSVIGGCFDQEFQEWSRELFDEFRTGKKIAVLSDVTFNELEDAPSHVREFLKTIPENHKEIVTLDEESR
jgi:hypothetical protein